MRLPRCYIGEGSCGGEKGTRFSEDSVVLCAIASLGQLEESTGLVTHCRIAPKRELDESRASSNPTSTLLASGPATGSSCHATHGEAPKLAWNKRKAVRPRQAPTLEMKRSSQQLQHHQTQRAFFKNGLTTWPSSIAEMAARSFATVTACR